MKKNLNYLCHDNIIFIYIISNYLFFLLNNNQISILKTNIIIELHNITFFGIIKLWRTAKISNLLVHSTYPYPYR